MSSAALLLAAVTGLWMLGGLAADHLGKAITEALSDPHVAPLGNTDAAHLLLRRAGQLGLATVPMMLLMMAAAILINVTQTGLMVTPAKLMPKLSHISPLSGAKRIASLQGVMRLAFGLFKVAVIAAVACMALQHYSEPVLQLASMSVPQVAKTLFNTLVGTCLWIGAALFILALLEYAFQRWKHEQDLMMTDQEVRDEMKETEGDPQVAARRRQVQRQMAMNRIGSDVPQADVVLSNPTELAIAIQYDPVSMPAPVVLAKGAGLVAQRIRRLALENGVPVVERKPLVQALYKTVEVGEVIPTEQYQAVAEVLRYVYQMQGKEIPQSAA